MVLEGGHQVAVEGDVQGGLLTREPLVDILFKGFPGGQLRRSRMSMSASTGWARFHHVPSTGSKGTSQRHTSDL